MRDMELQKELDALKDAPFAKKTDAQLKALENFRHAGNTAFKNKTHNSEARKKMSIANKGKIRSTHVRKKMSNSRRNISIENRKKISEAVSLSNRNRKYSAETRKRMSESHNSKLSTAVAKKIRIEYSKGIKQKELSAKYKVTQSTISLIVNNKIFKQ